MCLLMQGEMLNMGPLGRRFISGALRLPVRLVTTLGLFAVTLSEELTLLLSVLLGLFSGWVVVFVWSAL